MSLQQQVPLGGQEIGRMEPRREPKESWFRQALRAQKGQVMDQAEPLETTMPPVFKKQRESASCPLGSTSSTAKK